MEKENIINWQDLALSDNHLFGPMKEDSKGKHYASDKEVKMAVMKWLKEQSPVFHEAEYMLSSKGGMLLLREMVTMLRSRNVINRGPASF